MKCPLCQYRFGDRGACHGCGFTKGCTMIKCPNCGYEYVERSRTIEWIQKWIGRFRKGKKEEVTL